MALLSRRAAGTLHFECGRKLRLWRDRSNRWKVNRDFIAHSVPIRDEGVCLFTYIEM